ncbi:MAG: hypothetical protein AAFV19_11605 [Pseudomonadota bacterium]
MTVAFITLTFSWLWLVIAWVLVGAPLFALLMIWRIATETGLVRRLASVALVAGAAAVFGIWIFLDQGDRYPNSAAILMFVGLCVAIPSWFATAWTARRGRVWPDLIVAAVPTMLGLWAWASE